MMRDGKTLENQQEEHYLPLLHASDNPTHVLPTRYILGPGGGVEETGDNTKRKDMRNKMRIKCFGMCVAVC